MPKDKCDTGSGRITPNMLGRAKNHCSQRGALPKDWDDWFPRAMPLLDGAGIQGPHITVQNILDYARVRMEDVNDPTRFIEAAQCLMLIHFLDNPSPDTIVTSVYGK